MKFQIMCIRLDETKLRFKNKFYVNRIFSLLNKIGLTQDGSRTLKRKINYVLIIEFFPRETTVDVI